MTWLSLSPQKEHAPLPDQHPPKRGTLTALGLDLDRRALGTLLAGNAASLALGSGSGALGLLSLLGRLLSLLLLLALLDGGQAGGAPGLGAHRAALLDHLKRGTDDGTLRLDGAAGALLGDFL